MLEVASLTSTGPGRRIKKATCIMANAKAARVADLTPSLGENSGVRCVNTM